MGLFQSVAASAPAAARAASNSPAPPREERVGRGPRRGETNKKAPPLPSPLLHPMEERETSRSLMQPCLKRKMACSDLPLARFWLSLAPSWPARNREGRFEK